MKNSDYWLERMRILEGALLDTGYDYVENLEKQYDAAIRDIEADMARWYQRFAKNNEISLADAKKLLKTKDLDEFKWTVEEYIKYGRENALDGQWIKELENASARVHVSRLESIKLQLRQQAEVLAAKQTTAVEQSASKIYESSYYRTAYELQKGVGIGWTLHSINADEIRKVLSKPWTLDKRTFSDRIWSNKQSLINTVNTELTQMIMRGAAPDNAIKAISERFKVSKTQSGRLVMTESAAFANEARKDCFKELDVEEYIIVETLDGKTCELCASLDGKVYPMSEYQIGVTAPPFHPWCRGTTAPYFADMEDIGERWARDANGKTYEVPKSMTYRQWKKKYVDNAEKSGIIKSLDIDDFGMMAASKNILPEVSDTISKTIKEFEAKGGMYISEVHFGDFFDAATGRTALFQVIPNQYGLVEINVNSRILGGLTVEEINTIIANAQSNLPNNLKEAVVHECGHAKLIYGMKAKEVEKLYSVLEKIHVDGVSPAAFRDGAECIAEVEVLLYRNEEVPKEAKALYDKYMKGTRK